jgi:multiple sugar transport system ATP-binding protein
MFGSHTAVAPTDQRIADGEFLVLVGPSGCGKTTTLRMIAGLETPTAGQIFIGPREVTDLEPKDRDIAMVFQNYALYPHMKVVDNLAYSLRLRKVDKETIARRIASTAAMLGIASLLDRYPRQLSGGQQQRVALGRAIVRQPQVFLMDEPLSNLDAKLRVQTRAELIKLHKQLRTTVVYVTHDQIEAMTMGSRIAVMKDGFMQQVGTPAEIYRQPTREGMRWRSG